MVPVSVQDSDGDIPGKPPSSLLVLIAICYNVLQLPAEVQVYLNWNLQDINERKHLCLTSIKRRCAHLPTICRNTALDDVLCSKLFGPVDADGLPCQAPQRVGVCAFEIFSQATALCVGEPLSNSTVQAASVATDADDLESRGTHRLVWRCVECE